MSILGAIVSFFIIGTFLAIFRIFFFVDIDKVEERRMKKVKEKSYLLFSGIGFSYIVSAILFVTNYQHISNPIETLQNDFENSKTYYGLFLLMVGMIFIISREKAIQYWEEEGVIFPISKEKYRIFAITIGILLFVIGLTFIIV